MLANSTPTEYVNLSLKDTFNTRSESDAGLQRFKPRQNKFRNFESMVMSKLHQVKPTAELKTFTQQELRRLTVSIQICCEDIATQYLKQCVDPIFTVFVKRNELL